MGVKRRSPTLGFLGMSDWSCDPGRSVLEKSPWSFFFSGGDVSSWVARSHQDSMEFEKFNQEN